MTGVNVSMVQAILAGAGFIALALGTGHGPLTLRDLVTPRAFTPTDDAVRHAMQGARLAFNPRVNLWEAWLGLDKSPIVKRMSKSWP